MNEKRFNKVIIWGLKTGKHTHRFVHNGFFKAFNHLGYDTLFLDDTEDNRKGLQDTGNCLYLTVGEADKNIPIREDNTYILHNCDIKKYGNANTLRLQVAALCNNKLDECDKVNDWTYYDKKGKMIYILWATDLLPHEFDFSAVDYPRKRVVNWVGTVAKHGPFENAKNLELFQNACDKNDVEFVRVWQRYGQVSNEKNIELIKESYMAPAIVGTWQFDTGFIPCRTFKNVSYGQLAASNSPHAKKVFGDLMIQNDSPFALFYDVDKEIHNKQKVIDAMKFVQEKHTYINRIEDILKVL